MLPLPNPGDANAYAAKGQELLQQAGQAASGDHAAAAGLIGEGVTVIAATAPGSPVATIAVDILGGAAAGFAMGGPVGALGGALGGMAAAASSLSGGNSASITDPGAVAVQSRLLAWSRALPVHDFAVNPATGEQNPMGWALYDYVAQVARRPRSGFGVATPWHWLFWDGIVKGKFGVARNGSFAENGDDPAVRARYLSHVLSAIKTLPGMSTQESLDHAVTRVPNPDLFSIYPDQTAGHWTGNVHSTFSLFLDIGTLPYPLPDAAKLDAFLAMATIFGMLAMGAISRAIASELMMQRSIFETLDAGYRPSANAAALLDTYVAAAHAEMPAPAPAPLPVPQSSVLLGHLAGIGGLGNLSPAVLGGITTIALDDWAAYYLGEKGPPV